ncbi:MAG: HepT-like ribonuclease domain-containing protein, partial [Vicinamibacteria bacterium]
SSSRMSRARRFFSLKPPEVRKYLFDAVEACDLITQFVSNKTFTDYQHDRMLKSAVERQFEIVGEALIGFLRLAPDLQARITDARRIIAFRNRLIHGYASVADELVWGIVETNLTVLRRELDALMTEE